MSQPGGLLSLAKAASWSVVRQAATLRHTCVVSRNAISCDSSLSSPYWFRGFSTIFALQCLWRASPYYSTMNHFRGQLILLSFQMSCFTTSFYFNLLCCVYFNSGDDDQTRTHQTFFDVCWTVYRCDNWKKKEPIRCDNLQPAHYSSLTAPNFQPTATQEPEGACDNQHYSRELLMMGMLSL